MSNLLQIRPLSIADYIQLKFVFFSETENEVQSCYKQWICNSIISKPLMDMQGQAEAEENLCHTLYNCHHRKFITGETVEDVLDHIGGFHLYLLPFDFPFNYVAN